MFTLMCQHQSLSLSLHLQTRFGSRSDPNGIQDRMFRQFKNVCMRQKVRKALIPRNVRLCRTKADAHNKFEFSVLIGSSCNKISRLTDPNIVLRYLKKPSQNKRFMCKHCAASLLYDLLSKFANSLCPEDRGQTCIPRVIIVRLCAR